MVNRLKYGAGLMALLATVLLLLCVHNSSAQGTLSLYDNLSPKNIFDEKTSSELSDTKESYQSEAMPFVVPGDYKGYLTTVYVGLGGEGKVTISLVEDNEGSPGKVVESISGSVHGTGVYAFKSSLDPVLAPGRKYWIVAAADEQFTAEWHSSGPKNSAESVVNFGNEKWTDDGMDYALRVEATAPAVVPEPSAAALLGLTLCSTMIVRQFSLRRHPTG